MTNEKKPLFNLLDFFHVGYKKPTPEQLKYGNFNRRMFAFTIDTILLMIFIAPLVDYFFTVIYGPFPIDMQQLGLEMQAAATEEEKKQIFITTIKETGALDRWVAGTVTQLMVLLAIIGAFWYRWSATPGKMVMHLRIVDARTEGPITLYHIVLRLCGYVLCLFSGMIGFFWIGLDKRKQGWHDKLAETVVITIPLRKRAKPDSPAADPSGSPEPSEGA